MFAADCLASTGIKNMKKALILNNCPHAATLPAGFPLTIGRALCAAWLVMGALAGCGDRAKPAKPGQALASVNGEEITVLQLNEELQRAGVTAAQPEAASKQLLQVLIDRQLLQSEAAKENLDRDPKVLQAIERARALIIAQAYLQKRMGNVARPTAAEVEDYFNKHPEYFSNRKQFVMNELIMTERDLTPEVKAAVDAAASLEEVATWLDARKIRYGRGQVTRSTSELNPQVSSRLLAKQKGQLFIVKEGERVVLLAVAEVKEAPVTLQVASQQIEQFLAKQKNKELAAAELARLRSGARIEYLNKSMALDPKAAVPAAQGAAAAPDSAAAAGANGPGAGARGQQAGARNPRVPAAAETTAADKAALERGAAGLR
jgi:peptidyl-prolyl cis-trans isomerase C